MRRSLVIGRWWLVALFALFAPLFSAQAQERPAVLAGVGLADHDAGRLAHAGVLAFQTAKRPVGMRMDGMVGQLGGARVGAASLAIEVAPRLAMPGEPRGRSASRAMERGLFLFAAAGPTLTWYGASRSTSLMFAIGTRVGLGPWSLTAEQRFQENFSPFLVGLAF